MWARSQSVRALPACRTEKPSWLRGLGFRVQGLGVREKQLMQKPMLGLGISEKG